MSELRLSIAICTINTELCLRMLKSLLPFINKDDQVIVYVDGRRYLSQNDPLLVYCQKNNVDLFIHQLNTGLSSCRNDAMQRVENRYLLFFDDDTVLINNVLSQFREQFRKGKTLVGARLVMPNHYKKKLRFLSHGYSYLFGIHDKEEKIWGACFGFDSRIALENHVTFDDTLGRKGTGLQSGDDTKFIKEYRKISNNCCFLQEPVLHYFNPSRITIRYIVKRVFWQGRSEIRRDNFSEGWKKERRRSGDYRTVLQFITTVFLRTVFLLGCLWEKIAN